MPKITRPYAVPGEQIPFNMPVQILTITPFLNRHNSRDSLKVLANNLSLSKTPAYCTTQPSRRNVRDTKQPSIMHITWCSWIVLTLEYEVHVIFIPLDIQKVSPLENTEIGTALIHHVHGKLSWSSLVIIYMCKKVSKYPSHSLTYLPIYFQTLPPPPMIYIIKKFLKYYSINWAYHF